MLNQSFKNFEILLLEDGSTDHTLNLITSIHDHRIHIIHDPVNKGLTARLNQGIELAKGKYIARMDGDDFSFPNRFQKQIAFLESHQEIDLLATRVIAFNDNNYSIMGLLPYKGSHAEITKNPWNTIYMPHPTWMGKAIWFKKNRYKIPEVKRAEDQELLLRTYTSSHFHCLDEVLLAYRQRQLNPAQTIRTRKNLLNAQLDLFIQRQQWLNAAKATSVFAIKSAHDYSESIPYFNHLLYKKNIFDIPKHTLNEARQHIKIIMDIEKNA